jgi:hypothetical protein
MIFIIHDFDYANDEFHIGQNISWTIWLLKQITNVFTYALEEKNNLLSCGPPLEKVHQNVLSQFLQSFCDTLFVSS